MTMKRKKRKEKRKKERFEGKKVGRELSNKAKAKQYQKISSQIIIFFVLLLLGLRRELPL